MPGSAPDPLARLEAYGVRRRGSRREFQEQLAVCTGALVDLAGAVAAAIGPLAVAFVEADHVVVYEYEDLHAQVRDGCHSLEEACFLLLARQGPVGGDLRRIVATVRGVSDVYRASSLLRHIGRALTWVHPPSLAADVRSLLEDLGTQVAAVFGGAVEAWRVDDALAVVTLQRVDDQVDLLHRLLLTELYVGPQATEVSVSLALVARYFERVADHGVELARQLAYAVTGVRPGPRPGGQYAGSMEEGDP